MFCMIVDSVTGSSSGSCQPSDMVRLACASASNTKSQPSIAVVILRGETAVRLRHADASACRYSIACLDEVRAMTLQFDI